MPFASGIFTPRQVARGTGNGSLYTFSDVTLTSGGATGRFGPTLTQAKSGATSSGTITWKDNTEYFNVTATGIILWKVPATATYRIEVWGAQGGGGGYTGGFGARMRGDFSLTQGQVIQILVGQRGHDTGYCAGGGGGTFVALGSNRSTASPLIIAGGGGGGGNSGGVGRGGVTTTDGSPSSGYGGGSGISGTNGNGGSGSNGGWGESGAGFLTDSTSSKSVWSATRDTSCILSFKNGGRGASPWPSGSGSCISAGGGFGGGGGGGCNGGGGGGGYSGGGGGGCGGGSYNIGTNQSNSDATKSGHGQVTITLVAQILFM